MPAVSQSQQRFFGMVRASQKGTLKNPSSAVARAAKSMSDEDAHDFAATKHKGLPKKVGFAEKMAADEEAPKPKKKLGPLQHSYVADAPGGTAIENMGRLLRQQEIGDRGLYDQMILSQGPMAEALGARIRRGNSRLATSKGTRLLSLIDPTADGGPGLVELATGVGKKIPEQEEETRQMYTEHIKPYQDKVTEGPTTSRETPWYMSMEGNLANLDSDIAGHSYLRNERPGHYWLNPFSKSGPLAELGQRALRRSFAGNALPESTSGRFWAGAIPGYGLYTGGEEAQNRLRRAAMKNNLYDQVAVPEKAPAEKAANFEAADPGNLAIRHDGTGEDDPSVAMSWDDVMSNDISNHIADPIERRNFIASLMGLPIDEPQAQLPAQTLAKAAYVKLNPATREASKPKPAFQTPPHIGQPKAGPIVPPATQDATKMVVRSAPSVPNPIVPPTQSGDPMPAQQKVAGACTVPVSTNRYTSSAKKGKKPMPQPHARRLKQAAGPMTPTAFGASLATGIEKQALGVLGTAIGAAGGLMGAPSGNRMEGMGRGAGQGLGWDVGGGIGAGLGTLGGAAAGRALVELIAALQGRQSGRWADTQAFHQSMMSGVTAGAGLGGVAGYFGGGMLGRGAAKGLMGDPTWEQENSQRQTTAAQMAAP